MKEEFSIDYWLSQGEEPQKPKAPVATQPQAQGTGRYTDFIIVKDRIVQQKIDITAKRDDWLNIGFALAYDLGEGGREIYHEVSQFYPGYTREECDDQYTKCLNGHGATKVTGRTYFEIAKKHGIDIRTAPPRLPKSVESVTPQGGYTSSQTQEATPYLPAPSFSQEVYPDLPEFLQKVAIKGSNEREKDILILGALGVASATLPNIFGIYDDVTLYPNICFFITGVASAGKGRMNLTRRIIQPIHDELRNLYDTEKADYDSKMAQYDRDKHKKNVPIPDKPEKPPQRMLIVPGNTSATAVIQIMHDNDGNIVIFETEGDSLANSFNSDHGNYSESFRSAFHHESFGYHRRGGDEHVEVKVPKLSAVLSGTQEQIRTLIKTPENGLFSRFGFYYLEPNLEFKNVFKRSAGPSLDKYFDQLGQDYLEFYHELQITDPLEFSLTEEQQGEFLDFFSEQSTDRFIDFGEGFLATIRRLAVICFRIAMTLSGLRLMESGNFYEDIVCTDADFRTAMTISKTLLKHSIKVYCELFGEKQKPRLSSQDETRFFEALPAEFGRKDYLEAAVALKINPRTAEGYVNKFCGKMGLIEHIGYDKYRKKS